ncbi:MAG: hypothetical protein AAGK02_14230 [Pseudomonadota bacterium]
MKHHIMIALGLLLLVIFAYRGALALAAPGLGVLEAYIAGGLVLGGWLIRAGLAERRGHRSGGD